MQECFLASTGCAFYHPHTITAELVKYLIICDKSTIYFTVAFIHKTVQFWFSLGRNRHYKKLCWGLKPPRIKVSHTKIQTR